jgi:hypothetical protein
VQLGAELCIGAGADEHEVSNKKDELVGDAEKHAGGSCPIAPTICGRDGRLSPRGVAPAQRLAAPIELTPQVLRHATHHYLRFRRLMSRLPLPSRV